MSPALALIYGFVQLGLTKPEAVEQSRKLLTQFFPDDTLSLDPDNVIVYLRLQGTADRKAHRLAVEDIGALQSRGQTLTDAVAESYRANPQFYSERPWLRA